MRNPSKTRKINSFNYLPKRKNKLVQLQKEKINSIKFQISISSPGVSQKQTYTIRLKITEQVENKIIKKENTVNRAITL